MKKADGRISLKAYQSPDHPEMKWAVSGPGEGTARRWRKLFVTREEAEKFLLQVRGEDGQENESGTALPAAERIPPSASREDPVPTEERQSQKIRIRKKRRSHAWKFLSLLALLGVAFLVDRVVRTRLRNSDTSKLIRATDFETNPLLAGWVASDQGCEWTAAEHQSGTRSISTRGGVWTSPPMPVQSSSWYRVAFESKAGPYQDRRGRCTAEFVGPDGTPMYAITFAGVARLPSWQMNEFYVPSPPAEKTLGQTGEVMLRVRFPGDPNHPLYIDDVVVARVADSMTDVAAAAKRVAQARPSLSAAELHDAAVEFQADPKERPLFGDTFRAGSVFELQGMMVQGGEAFAAPEKVWPQLAYEFRQPLDLKEGDVTVYWAFRADRSVGEEGATLHTFLNFTGAPPSDRPEPARLAVKIRSVSFANMYVDPGWEMEDLAYCRLVGKGQSFPAPETVEKFRLQVRLVGGTAVLAEVAWWNRESRAWESFAAADEPGNGPAVMRLDVMKDLLGHTSFRSLFFQVVSDVPKVDTVFVTQRPPRRVSTDASPLPDAPATVRGER